MKEKLLVIGMDETEVAELESRLFTLFHCYFVPTITHGIEYTTEFNFPVIIYVMVNPEESVFADLENLKNNPNESMIIVISGTNTFMIEKIIRGIGIFYYLLKPYVLNDLLVLVQAALRIYKEKINYNKDYND